MRKRERKRKGRGRKGREEEGRGKEGEGRGGKRKEGEEVTRYRVKLAYNLRCVFYAIFVNETIYFFFLSFPHSHIILSFPLLPLSSLLIDLHFPLFIYYLFSCLSIHSLIFILLFLFSSPNRSSSIYLSLLSIYLSSLLCFFSLVLLYSMFLRFLYSPLPSFTPSLFCLFFSSLPFSSFMFVSLSPLSLLLLLTRSIFLFSPPPPLPKLPSFSLYFPSVSCLPSFPSRPL